MIFWPQPMSLPRLGLRAIPLRTLAVRMSAALLFAALLLRLIVPTGYMPAAGSLILCTGAGAVTISFDDHGRPIKPAASDSGECAFAAAPAMGPLPEIDFPPLPAIVAAAVVLVAIALRLGEGLGQPPCPSTGPPIHH
jgi:hypothetical protein